MQTDDLVLAWTVFIAVLTFGLALIAVAALYLEHAFRKFRKSRSDLLDWITDVISQSEELLSDTKILERVQQSPALSVSSRVYARSQCDLDADRLQFDPRFGPRKKYEASLLTSVYSEMDTLMNQWIAPGGTGFSDRPLMSADGVRAAASHLAERAGVLDVYTQRIIVPSWRVFALQFLIHLPTVLRYRQMQRSDEEFARSREYAKSSFRLGG